MKNENKSLKKFRLRFLVEEIIVAPNAEKARKKFAYDHGFHMDDADVYELPPDTGEDFDESQEAYALGAVNKYHFKKEYGK